MNRYKIASAVIGAGLMLSPLSALAASFTNVEFDNGDVTVQGTAGQVVNVKIRIVVPAGEVVEQLETDVLSDSLAPVCEAVGGSKGLEEGTHFVTRQVKLPPNTGTYTLQVKGSGVFGAFSAIDCINSNVGSNSFSSALKVVGGSSTSGPVLGGDDFWTKIAKMIADAIAATKPSKPAYCAGLVAYNGVNASAAQASLLATPHASFFTSKGIYAPTGYWGTISMTASAAAAAACN